jgi:hypothetical protein
MLVNVDIQPIELNGEHWVTINLGGHEKRKGPFANAAAAKAVADKLIQNWQPKTPIAPTSDDVVVLNNKAIALDSPEGGRLVVSCTRAAEGIIKDSDVIDEFEISIAEWESIKTNVKLGRAIRECGRQRVASGARTRDAAQHHFVKSPDILDKLQTSAASPRHVVEAIRELRTISSGTGDESPAGAAERFVIRIDLSAAPDGEVLEIEKTIDHQPKQIESESELNVDE